MRGREEEKNMVVWGITRIKVSSFFVSKEVDVPSPPIFAECDNQEYECEWKY
jgi:hypothetical protein